jgi:hypothetical protein
MASSGMATRVAVGQAKARAPAAFAAGHAAAVGFVVHAQQVEQAVEHEDPHFVLELMAELAGLGARTGQGDGEVA